MNNNYHINFQARLGKNITQNLRKEFDYNETQFLKYEKLFQKTFETQIDKNTIVDINKGRSLMFSHTLFPDIKYCKSHKLPKDKPLGQTLLNQCPKDVANGEFRLFELIISTAINKGKSFKNLFKISEKFKNDNSKASFQDLINIAIRIKKEKPKSKLDYWDFSCMRQKMMQEELQDPNSHLSTIIKNLGLSLN